METMTGEIDMFAFMFNPQNYMECAGQTLNISTYQALYTLIGTKFGGNGSTTFCLPDLRGAALFGGKTKYYICINGIYPSRS